MRTGDPITFDDVLAVRETAKALGCVPLGRTNLFWVPKSQLQNGTQVAHLGDHGTLVVSEWWAQTSKVHLNFEERAMSDELPVADVVLVRDERQNYWRVLRCPYCHRTHHHGAGEPHQNPSDFLGTRWSHCREASGEYQLRWEGR